MKAWQKPGFWLPLVIVLVWGGVVLLIHQDTMRETAFILLMSVGLASSLNILLGYTGYVSFGHIVFFGLGGYFGFYLLSEAGLPLSLPDRGTSVRFRATLVMPLAILRANACVAGDTAVWEFAEEDLFGRGFEMTAVASAR